MTFVDEYDVFSDAKNGVHVMGVDDSSDVILVSDIAEELVN